MAIQTVHIAKDGRQYILKKQLNGRGYKKQYGNYGKPGVDFKNYIKD